MVHEIGPVLVNSNRLESTLEKLISIWSYRIALASVVLALLFRVFATLAISIGRLGVPGGLPINYRTFYDGAILFLVVAIASSCLGSKSQ